MAYENEHWAIRVNDELHHVGTESAFDVDRPCELPEAEAIVGGGQCDNCGAGDGFQVGFAIANGRKMPARFANCPSCGHAFRFVMAHEDDMEW